MVVPGGSSGGRWTGLFQAAALFQHQLSTVHRRGAGLLSCHRALLVVQVVTALRVLHFLAQRAVWIFYVLRELPGLRGLGVDVLLVMRVVVVRVVMVVMVFVVIVMGVVMMVVVVVVS